MAAPINLEVLDVAILEQTHFDPDMQRWLSNIVDIINASFASIQNALATIIAVGQTTIGGSGAGPYTITVAGLVATNFVNVTLVSSTNPVSITLVQAGSGSFQVTFSGDPGAGSVIAYQAFTVQPT